MESAQAIEVFSKINLDEKVIETIRKNKKLVAGLTNIIATAGGSATKVQGNLLYVLSTKLPPTQSEFTPAFVEQIMKNNWTKPMQLDEAFAYLKEKLAKHGTAFKLDTAEFETATGVGINLTDEDIQKLVDTQWASHQEEINEKKYDFQFSKLLYEIKEINKWADAKIVNQKVTEKQLAELGEKP